MLCVCVLYENMVEWGGKGNPIKPSSTITHTLAHAHNHGSHDDHEPCAICIFPPKSPEAFFFIFINFHVIFYVPNRIRPTASARKKANFFDI